MPTYVYKFVDTGETIEVQQGFHDDNLTEIAHPDSGEVLPVKKVFTPVGVTFKGSGFFKTDNRGKKSASSTVRIDHVKDSVRPRRPTPAPRRRPTAQLLVVHEVRQLDVVVGQSRVPPRQLVEQLTNPPQRR